MKPVFDRIPDHAIHTINGVDYVHVKGHQSGDIYFTRFGWPLAEHLLPENWFTGEQFHKRGRALAGATGAVYRVTVPHHARKEFPLVVKFSRFGQDVGVTMAQGGGLFDEEFRNRMDTAEFLPPFEEFGNADKLRRQAAGLFTMMRPLAIYSPATRHLPWQLGRKSYLEGMYQKNLSASQSMRPGLHLVHYDWERLYILLYQWIDGIDLEQACARGLIKSECMRRVTLDIHHTLGRLGWVVLDHKPRHVIVRPSRRSKRLLERHGKWPVGLIDYELLFRRANKFTPPPKDPAVEPDVGKKSTA
ncbi:hypothetical protein QQ056_17655 [Oscillatoria laete-virens NRMC-F 0139]|nr:hypothetical protein [Oscillatoria laete-virens NRMC-F 0139]